MNSKILIRGARLLDPAQGLDAIQDIYVADGHIAALGGAPEGFEADEVIEAAGLCACPGLIDLRARLREPGDEKKGTIASETLAAASGGITTLCCPPDTDPVADSPALVKHIRGRVKSSGNRVRVFPLGALTRALDGEHISEMAALKEAGCHAVSNADRPMANTLVLRRAFEYATSLELPILLRSEDPWLSNGIVHEGTIGTRLGLPAIPAIAETIAVVRDLMLAEQTGARIHFCCLSTAGAIEEIAQAQQRGLPVTADVSAHQLYLTEMDVGHFNPHCHVRPPLRTQRDRDALRAALASGVITAICSDHQPHDRDAKLAPFPSTEPGISALETLLPLTLRLVDEGVLSPLEAIARLTLHPARVLGQALGSLEVGAIADICLFDPQRHWTVTEQGLLSRGKNTPFLGWELKGKVVATLLKGHVVFREEP